MATQRKSHTGSIKPVAISADATRTRLPKLQRVWYFRYVTSAALPWKASARRSHGYNNRQYPVSATALSSYLSRSCLLCSKFIVGKPSIHRGTKKHFEDWEDGGNIMFVLYSSMAVIYFTWWGIFINVVVVMLWSLVSSLIFVSF